MFLFLHFIVCKDAKLDIVREFVMFLFEFWM